MRELWRLRCANPADGWMFPSEHGNTPVRMNNIVNRQIKPAWERCAYCKVSECNHDDDYHEYSRPISAGSPDATIQKSLRHASAETTRKRYIKPLDSDMVEGMAPLQKNIADLLKLYANGAQTMDATHGGVVN